MALEAFYSKPRYSNEGGMNPAVPRTIFKLLFGMGGLAFFVVGIGTLLDSSGWTNSATGEPISQTTGTIIGVSCILASCIFWAIAWYSDKIPLNVNGIILPPEGAERSGLAWKMNLIGLAYADWTGETIPWSEFQSAKVDTEDEKCDYVHFFFKDKSAVKKYIGQKEAESWNPGYSYALPVAATNLSITQIREFMDNVCPNLLQK
jgi:hypothetical protein